MTASGARAPPSDNLTDLTSAASAGSRAAPLVSTLSPTAPSFTPAAGGQAPLAAPFTPAAATTVVTSEALRQHASSADVGSDPHRASSLAGSTTSSHMRRVSGVPPGAPPPASRRPLALGMLGPQGASCFCAPFAEGRSACRPLHPSLHGIAGETSSGSQLHGPASLRTLHVVVMLLSGAPGKVRS